jgi:hypothetical protein
MDFLNILKEIEKVDVDVYDRLNPRRAAMKEFFNVGKNVAVASVPFAIGSMFKKAYGQGGASAGVISVLNYSLTIELFGAEFYRRGVNEAKFSEANANAAADKAAITIIRDHELGHVKFLQDTIRAAGGTPVTSKTYDFTGKGEFTAPFTNYRSFLQIAQGIEDVGLRATKGVAGELAGQSVYLTAALNMHAVEARHSAKIRLMRLAAGFSKTLQPWVSLNDETDGRLGASLYAGEQNVTQAGVSVVGIGGNSNVDGPRASEAFDEPLSKAEISKILANYGVVI